ncbi:integrase/recombinase xerD homolog [Pecten maximus]|uniref:integrase/recombinase xerD homolog n=1 Tax=Pecten maximus TaxID=6579 RepID=UPI001458CFAC|nr:integrase/recombinase xerD homolog [Pecten maximus]
MPANEFYVALYLSSLIQSGCHFSKIEEVIFSLSWCHKIAGFQDPCSDFLVQSVRLSGKRILSCPVKKKEPITPDILNKLVDKYGNAEASLKDLRLISMCLVGFAGFLRFSEIVNIKYSDISFEDSFMVIFISRSKTDKFNAGSSVVIAATHNKTCPVEMLKRNLVKGNFSHFSNDLYIFSQVCLCKSEKQFRLRAKNVRLSYTRAREILLEALEAVGLDKTLFGVHSLRSGGATAAAAAGVSDRLFKKHGRWKSEKAKDGYVRERVHDLLSVSQHLGI